MNISFILPLMKTLNGCFVSKIGCISDVLHFWKKEIYSKSPFFLTNLKTAILEFLKNTYFIPDSRTKILQVNLLKR